MRVVVVIIVCIIIFIIAITTYTICTIVVIVSIISNCIQIAPVIDVVAVTESSCLGTSAERKAVQRGESGDDPGVLDVGGVGGVCGLEERPLRVKHT